MKTSRSLAAPSLNYRLLLFFSLFALLLISTSNFIYLNFFSTWSDAAGFVSLFDNVRSGQGMVSPMYNAGTWFFEINSGTDIKTWCEFPSVNRYENFSRWHPYLILFPLAAIGNILQVSSLAILSCLVALSYISPVAHIFHRVYLKNNCSLANAILLTILPLSFPVWFGGIEGQLQSDRLFVGPIYFITFALLQFSRKGLKRIQLILLSISIWVTALISERAATYLILVLLVVIINIAIQRKLRLAASLLPSFVITLLYFLIWNFFIQDSTYYSRSSLNYFLTNFLNSFTEIPAFTLLFIFVVSPFILISSRNSLGLQLALVAILPQFLWTTGGSEKIGFITQYHAGYLGILLAAFSFGMDSSIKTKKAKESGIIKVNFAVTFLYVGFLALSPLWIPTQGHQLSPANVLVNLGLVKSEITSLEKIRIDKIAFVEDIPIKSWISAPEALMPALTFTDHHNVDYYPMGIRYNQFAIETRDADGSSQIISPWLTGLLPRTNGQREILDSCYKESLRESSTLKSTIISGVEYKLLELSPQSSYRKFPPTDD